MNNFYIKVYNGKEERLDSFITKELDKFSRSQIKNLINDELILVNGKAMKASYNVEEGDLIEITIPEPKKIKLIPENIPINIIYEDEDIVIVNKAQNIVVHPGSKNHTGTLVNGLLYHIEQLSTINKDIRPGIVHRIDKDTSGILVVAKNNKTHKILSSAFKARQVKRVYLALVHGVIDKDSGTINAPIGRNETNRMKMTVKDRNARKAISHYKVLHRFHNYTLIEVSLETGRTHQIRVHMSYLNHPIVGDPLYSNRENEFGIKKQMLHAYKLEFVHPIKKELMEFTADLPSIFSNILNKLNKK